VIYDRLIVEALGTASFAPWSGTVFRHMFAGFPPERENRSGARWNPPDTPAIYTSLTRETAIAEADYYIKLQPLRPKAARELYRLDISLNSVIDLSDWTQLANFGVNRKLFSSGDYSECQQVGGAVEWLGHDGLLVPSARTKGINLVIFPNCQTAEYKFQVIDCEELST
jgi:RES domain-containing protein